MINPIVDVENLQKSYGDFKAVSGISFHIKKGEFFGILGPNGAGKTTTIGMLTGIIPPSSGKIIIDGQNLKTHADICKSKIGLVPQDFAFYPSLNALDNLIFFGRIYGLRGRYLDDRIDEVLRLVVLSNNRKQPVATFSNGMKRRLNIAIGLLHNPQILILDEPNVGVDAQSRTAIFDGLKDLNKAGVTIIYTTHYMKEAQTLCHRVAIVDQGRIIQLDTPSALIRQFSDTAVKIEFSDQLARPLVEGLHKIGKVEQLDDTARRFIIHSLHPARTVKKILELKELQQTPMQSLDVIEPNLETVFLHLTGRSLRDN